MNTPWIAVPPAALLGEGLEPYPPGDISALFDWSENPAAASTHLMAFAGEFLLDIVDIEANAVHQHCKPDDEIVFVEAGTLRLTSDVDGSQMAIPAGDAVFIPRGWAGIYRADPGRGRFIEAALVASDYFDPSISRVRTDAVPIRLTLPASQQEELHCNSWKISKRKGSCSEVLATMKDILVRNHSGCMTLSFEGASQTFGANQMIVLRGDSRMHISTSADFLGSFICLSRA